MTILLIFLTAVITFIFIIMFSSFVKVFFKKRVKVTDIVLTGGPAIILTFLLTVPLSSSLKICLIIIFLLGLVDDIWNLKPLRKLIVEILLAYVITQNEITLELTDNLLINDILTIGWIVFMTNAFNLSDNMDGNLCSIIFAISSGIIILNPDKNIMIMCYCLMGCMLGFFSFNWKPATVYMGDSGSLFLGFLFAYISIYIANPYNGIDKILTPIFLLFVPFIDTVFVMISRTLKGKSIFQGGKDHISHNLARLYNEEIAVLLLSFISFMSIVFLRKVIL